MTVALTDPAGTSTEATFMSLSRHPGSAGGISESVMWQKQKYSSEKDVKVTSLLSSSFNYEKKENKPLMALLMSSLNVSARAFFSAFNMLICCTAFS